MSKGKYIRILGDNIEISDGYHTFSELYDHRCLLFVNMALMAPKRAAWKPDVEGWFLLYLDTNCGQISYHVPEKFRYLVENKVKRASEIHWDGHTSQDVILRLTELAQLDTAVNSPMATQDIVIGPV